MFLVPDQHRFKAQPNSSLAERDRLRTHRLAIALIVLSSCYAGLPARAADDPENETPKKNRSADDPENETLKKNKLRALGSLQVLEDETEFKNKLTEARRLQRQLSYSLMQQQNTMSPEQFKKNLQAMKDELTQMRSQISQLNQQMASVPRFRGRFASTYAQEQYNECLV